MWLPLLPKERLSRQIARQKQASQPGGASGPVNQRLGLPYNFFSGGGSASILTISIDLIRIKPLTSPCPLAL
ncbi:MAG TPA: hypothetical protein VFF94_09795, partial [Novosphingobium sp.]|nr:hypothetical protein [Novosphingobium sp.]